MTSYSRAHPVVCSCCDASIPGSAWSRIRASEGGWFFQRDGAVFCPAHVPEWVAQWRARQRAEHACSRCEASVTGNKGSAIDEGWFFRKDGTVYCPVHVPGELAWRARQQVDESNKLG